MDTTTFEVTTGGEFACADLTPHIRDFARGRGDGLCHVFVPHATAGVTLLELGAGTEEDASAALAHLLPRDDRWIHRHGSEGHGADHLLPLVCGPSLTLPVFGGEPALGAWQSVALIDPNVDNPTRTVRLSWIPGGRDVR
ncbi:secondary thiamine-phosphate synthase enzyme YjbQ [soil metagenome]